MVSPSRLLEKVAVWHTRSLAEEHLGEIDALSAEIFQDVNNGVCKAGFIQSQGAYSDAFHLVFGAFDRLEERLSKRRFLFGDYITESARFDLAYCNGFFVNFRLFRDYPNLWGYARDLFAEPAFANNTDFDAIRKHYHLCCLATNPNSILPVGPDESLWSEPAERESLSKDPEHRFLEEQQA